MIFYFRNQFFASSSFVQQQPQWNTGVNTNEYDMSGDMNMTPGSSTGQAPKVNNHQKTSERMCEDESMKKFLPYSNKLLIN